MLSFVLGTWRSHGAWAMSATHFWLCSCRALKIPKMPLAAGNSLEEAPAWGLVPAMCQDGCGESLAVIPRHRTCHGDRNMGWPKVWDSWGQSRNLRGCTWPCILGLAMRLQYLGALPLCPLGVSPELLQDVEKWQKKYFGLFVVFLLSFCCLSAACLAKGSKVVIH